DNRPPVRKHPSRNSVHEQGFRSTILFVTVCTEGRKPILAEKDMVNIILSTWANAQNWIVGRYVIMPDHIHFFCAPATYPTSDFHRWMKYWKRLAQQAFAVAARGDTRPHVGGRLSSTAENMEKLWQDDCWDTQIRTGVQYEEKWQYVRNNPVRKGLVENSDDWPYHGFVNDVPWHD
ncbi:MAG: transposase, partial [Kiritimatiellae bacterium]|nr:transposase [Kiritimatiellia bacterium]